MQITAAKPAQAIAGGAICCATTLRASPKPTRSASAAMQVRRNVSAGSLRKSA